MSITQKFFLVCVCVHIYIYTHKRKAKICHTKVDTYIIQNTETSIHGKQYNNRNKARTNGTTQLIHKIIICGKI